MKVLTMNTDYAIRALLLLATRREAYTSAREIADLGDIPYPYLRRILRLLIKNGVIESKEGSAGGVRLPGDPAKIRIVDVMRIFQGEVEISDCLVRGEICANRSTCVLRREVKRIEKLLNGEFAKITIGSLLRQSKQSSSRGTSTRHRGGLRTGAPERKSFRTSGGSPQARRKKR